MDYPIVSLEVSQTCQPDGVDFKCACNGGAGYFEESSACVQSKL